MSEHTPGPWTPTEPRNSWRSVLAREGAVGEECIAYVSMHIQAPNGDFTDQGEANAHLIAAAPEMLAVLESVYVDLVDYSKRLSGSYDTGAIALGSCADDVARVIAKARGAQP